MTDNADVLANVSIAFYGKFTAVDGGGAHNAFYTAMNGQLYEDEAPEGIQYPYSVYKIISAPKEKTFSEVFTNISLQLSIYSSNMDSSEIKDAYAHASVLFDECSFSITGSALIWIKESNLVSLVEEVNTPTGVQRVRAYHIEYEVKTNLN